MTELDLKAMANAIFREQGIYPDFDLDLDQRLTMNDLQIVLDVYARRRPGLFSANLFPGGESAQEAAFVEVRGMNFDPSAVIRVNGQNYRASEWGFEQDGSEFLRAYFPGGFPFPEKGNQLSVETAQGVTRESSLDYEPTAVDVADQAWTTTLPPASSFFAPGAQQPLPDPCCIEAIKLRSRIPGLRAFVFDDRGTPAEQNGDELRSQTVARRDGSPIGEELSLSLVETDPNIKWAARMDPLSLTARMCKRGRSSTKLCLRCGERELRRELSRVCFSP